MPHFPEDNWIDITRPVYEGMICWPGDPGFRLSQEAKISEGSVANVSRFELGAHTGTHMDAPLHFIADGDSLGRLPLEAVVGEARVIGIDDPRAITAEELEQHDPRPGERLLFKTANCPKRWQTDQFDEAYIAVHSDAARLLVERQVRTIGVDYLSVGLYGQDNVKTHRLLLGAGIWVIEGLDLTAVAPGLVDLVCLPMKVIDAEGAPARVIVRPR